MQQATKLDRSRPSDTEVASRIRLRRLYLRYESLIWGGGTIIFLLAAWEAASQLGWLNTFFFSRPSEIFQQLIRQFQNGVLVEALVTTLYAFVIGFTIAMVVGILVGLLAGWYRHFEYVVDPFVWFFYNAPKVAFYPLLIIWVGLGTPTVIALAAIFAVFSIYANTFAGVREVDPLHITAARAFGAKPRDLFVHVVLPGAMPFIVAGLRIGLGRAMLGVIVGEVFGSPDGLGARMNHEASMLRTDSYFATLAVVIFLGLVLTQILRLFERRLERWRAGHEAF